MTFGRDNLLFMRMKIPQVITIGQGREFTNELNSDLMHCLGIKHRLTRAYHPQESTDQTVASLACENMNIRAWHCS